MNDDKHFNPIMRQSDGVSLHEHIDGLLHEFDKRYEQRFAAQEQATLAALNSAQLAVDKAEANTKLWQANSNEWRGTMTDKDKLYMTKAECYPRFEAFEKAINDLNTLRDIAIGKASQNAVLLAVVGSLIGIALGLASLFGGK